MSIKSISGLITDCFISSVGLSIVGGRETPLGQHGAYITKVKKGSIADTVGHLRPGTVQLQCLNRLIMTRHRATSMSESFNYDQTPCNLNVRIV